MDEVLRAAEETKALGATEFCIVAAVRGPDARLMAQLREGVAPVASVPYAGFWLRVLALVIDAIILVVSPKVIE